MRQHKKVLHALLLGVMITVGCTSLVSAAQSSSANYSVDETFFGSGGELNACSTNYCSKQAAGETAVGNASSSNFQIQAGNNTARDNSLEMDVTATNIDVGQLTADKTKTAVGHFSVKSYLASGYVVYTDSPGPQNSSHILQLLSVPTSSVTGNEQFGINLVANSCPTNTPSSGLGSCNGVFGAAPVEVPDTSFAYGYAASGYDTGNSFKYHDGDIIAGADSSSGETDYTISYLFNISAITPGGNYTMHHVLIATSTF